MILFHVNYFDVVILFCYTAITFWYNYFKTTHISERCIFTFDIKNKDMKLLHLIFMVLVNTYFTSADPNLFGSVKRRKGKQNIANEFKAMATGSQAEIDQIKAENPFESAGAKAAMARASSGAKQMQTRMLNTMGSGATAEALVGAQGATNEAVGSAAGQIAVGAEANKANQISNLRGEKTQQMGMYGGMSSSAESERGTGWNTLFQGINAIGSLTSGAGQAAKALTKV